MNRHVQSDLPPEEPPPHTEPQHDSSGSRMDPPREPSPSPAASPPTRPNSGSSAHWLCAGPRGKVKAESWVPSAVREVAPLEELAGKPDATIGGTAEGPAEGTVEGTAAARSEPTGRYAPDPQLESLVEAMLAGDEAALGAFFDATHPKALTRAFGILQDYQLAEEAVLDAFHQVWRTAATYDPRRGDPLAWLLNIVRSRAIDRFRQLSSRAERASVEHASRGEHDSEEPPECDAQVAERAAHLRQCLAQLPSDQERVVRLAFFDGWTHATIAERLGLPVGTVKTRIRLGLEKLRRLFPPIV